MGISYIHPDGEASYASELCRIGYVDYVVTEDMDSLVFGCPNMIRTCLDKSIKRNDVVSIINLETILKEFNMNMEEFTDMCIAVVTIIVQQFQVWVQFVHIIIFKNINQLKN